MKGRKGKKSLLWDSAEVKHIGPSKQKKKKKLSAGIFKPV